MPPPTISTFPVGRSVAVCSLASKIGWDGLVAAEEKDSMMNQAYGWMGGGGMWIWTVIGVLVAILLVVAINKVSTK